MVSVTVRPQAVAALLEELSQALTRSPSDGLVVPIASQHRAVLPAHPGSDTHQARSSGPLPSPVRGPTSSAGSSAVSPFAAGDGVPAYGVEWLSEASRW